MNREGDPLRESEERFYRLAENALDIIYRYRFVPEPGFEYVSPAATVITGYTPEEHYADPDLGVKIVHPEDRALLEQVRSGNAFGQPITLRWIRKDGTIIWTEQRNVPIYDEAGNLIAIEGIARDVTERKRAEEEIRRLKEFNETIVQSVAEALLIEDAQGRITFVNPATERLLGYSADELIGCPWHKIVPPDEQERIQTRMTQRPTGNGDQYETRLVRKDGVEIPVLVHARPLFYQGTFSGVLSAFTDITKLKRTEKLLQGLNRAALAADRALTHDAIWAAVTEVFRELGFSCVVLLLDEEQQRAFPKYVSHDAQVIQMLEEETGFKLGEFSIPIATLPAFQEAIAQQKAVFVSNAKEFITRALPANLASFAPRLMEVLPVPHSIVAPLIVQDKVIGLLSVQSNDLTEEDIPAMMAFAHQLAAAWHKAQLMEDLRRNLEDLQNTQAQLLQAQKLESVGQLAGGIAHDFNNILTVILGHAQLALSQVIPADPIYRDLNAIEQAAQRAAKLTRQLLAFSRRQRLEMAELDLNDLIDNFVKMLQRVIGEDIEVQLDLAPGLGAIYADGNALEQVLMNLAVNARDAMPRGGILRISTGKVEISPAYCQSHPEAKPGTYVQLSVADTGIGMDEKTRERLFEPFFTTKEKGTGLGLSVVYGIVKQHGGWIEVWSAPGKGTIFAIYLPVPPEGSGKSAAEQ
jgi:two-component system cell cycle sensor histidine kinase/response regulator CckA